MVVASGGEAPSQLAQATAALATERAKARTLDLIEEAQYLAMHGGDYYM